MSKIMISELEATTTAPDSSFIAIDDGTTTNKITVENFNSNANATAKYYAEQAEDFATAASGASSDATSAKNATEAFVGTASDYANAASTSASAAAGSATEASGYVGSARSYATNAQASAVAAAASAANIDDQVKLAKSWAVGNTGARGDEATNNAKYWSSVAQAAAGGGVTTFNGRDGVVLPTSGDYPSDYITHVNTDSTTSDVKTEINGIKAALPDKITAYASSSTQWDTAPTDASTKPVTSGGIYTALGTKADSSDLANYEPVHKILTQTLSAGSTSVTFTDAAITADAVIEVFTSKAGLNYTAVDDTTTGVLIFTYPAQTSPISVKLDIRG